MLRWLIIIIVAIASYADAFEAQELVDTARNQVGKTLIYDPSYQTLDYPNGDISMVRGVCTDVVIRAYRGVGLDLQKLVHEDMRAHWKLYPKLWKLNGPDRNIDHRRVPNLAKFFARFGQSFEASKDASSYQAGDIVTWKLPSGVPHIGVVSNRKSEQNVPLIIHNVGLGAREENVLFANVITGHFRYSGGGKAKP